MHTTVELRRITDRQHGYFTAQQAIKVGYAYKGHNYHTNAGNWLQVERGVFRLPGYADSVESDFVRWSLWAIGKSSRRKVVISHDSAMYFYGLSRRCPTEVHLTVPPRQFSKNEKTGCVIHRQELSDSETKAQSGFTITTPERTLLDMKPVLMLNAKWGDTVNAALSAGLIDSSITQKNSRGSATDVTA